MSYPTVRRVRIVKHQSLAGLAAGVILMLVLAACAPAVVPAAEPAAASAATTASAPAATEKPAAAPTAAPAPTEKPAAAPTAAPAPAEKPTAAPTIAPTATAAPAATATQAPAAAKPATVSFAKDVKPILDQQCLKCHGGEKTEASLSMKDYAGLMAGSENGPVVKPGNADDSEFVKLVTQGKMPKRATRLSADLVKTLQDWVNAGALNN